MIMQQFMVVRNLFDIIATRKTLGFTSTKVARKPDETLAWVSNANSTTVLPKEFKSTESFRLFTHRMLNLSLGKMTSYNSVESRIALINKFAKNAQAMIQKLPQINYQIIKLEQLVSNPEYETRKLCKFLELECYPKCIDRVYILNY